MSDFITDAVNLVLERLDRMCEALERIVEALEAEEVEQ